MPEKPNRPGGPVHQREVWIVGPDGNQYEIGQLQLVEIDGKRGYLFPGGGFIEEDKLESDSAKRPGGPAYDPFQKRRGENR